MKFSKLLDKSFENKEQFEIEKEKFIQDLFEDRLNDYEIVEAEIIENEDDGEIKVFVIASKGCDIDCEIEEAIELGDYEYSYQYMLHTFEQHIWESLYEFTENINETWDDLDELDDLDKMWSVYRHNKRDLNLQRYVDCYKVDFKKKCDEILRGDEKLTEEDLDDMVEQMIIHMLEYNLKENMMDYNLEDFKYGF